MSAVKTLAWTVAAWIGLGLVPVRADVISKKQAEWLWTIAWSGGPAVSSPSASALSSPPPSPSPVATPTPAPIAAPAPTPATFSPIIAGSTAVPAANTPAALMANVGRVPTSAAIVTAPGASSSPQPVDAFINMTAGPYPAARGLTIGNAQPWYDSSAAIQAFGGTVPNAQQQASFVQTVLQDVQHTYQISGMSPTLTTDPNTPAMHTVSVASGLSYPSNPNVIGITNVGGDGFSFIDKLNYASNPTDLAWAVAHNISHELMHAFGIGYHPDGGNSVDASSANWSTLTDPNTQFGPNATQLLLTSNYGELSGSTSASGVGAEALNPDGTTVDGDEVVATPEPATMAMWTVGALGGLMMLRRRAA